MNTKHTPGPWLAQETSSGEWEVFQPDDLKPTPDEPWYIAFVYDHANGAASRDNARLIAAAPDLLNAADKALKALIGIDRILHANGMMLGVECPAIPDLRAAIAKAIGQNGGDA